MDAGPARPLLGRSDVRCTAFSPDGKMLAVGGGQEGRRRFIGQVALWEVATGALRHAFLGHESFVVSLAFSADGNVLVSGSEDTTALVWDITGRYLDPGVAPLTGAALDGLWADLAGGDSEVAFRAIGRLSRAPAQAAPFLARHLRPVPATAPDRVARLVAALGHERFADRREAQDQLARLEAAAEPALRGALAEHPTLELRRRLDELLAALDPAKNAAMLRTLRAVEALERAGNPEAQEVLRTWAGGAPDARLTREAKASLDRLARRSAAER